MPAAKRQPTSDAIAVLRQEHDRLSEFLGQLERTTAASGPPVIGLLDAIRTELRVHAAMEQEILCPAFRAAGRRRDDDALCHDAAEESRVAELLLPGIAGAPSGSPELAARARVLRAFFRRHADLQERDMFRRVRKLIPRSELTRLGAQMTARRSALAPPTNGGHASP
jgi:hypothetical protein